MLIASRGVISTLQEVIVQSLHGCRNEAGAIEPLGTLDPKALEMAAITALQIAYGDVVWPATRKIRLPAPAPRYAAPFEE